MTISDSYFKAKRRRYARGGLLTQEELDAQNNVDTGVGTVAGLGSGIIDAAANTNEYGRQSTGAVTASSALKGVAAGSAFGPPGMLIGGALGAISGLIKGNRDHEQERKMIATQRLKQLQMDKDQANARLSANPELMTGSLSAQYFKTGGKLRKYAAGGDTGDDPTKKAVASAPLNPTHFATWNKVVDYARSKKLDPTTLDHDPNVGYGVIDEYNKANPDSTFDRTRVKDIQSMMLDYRQSMVNKMKAVPAQYAGDAYKKFGTDYAGFMPGLSGADNFPGSKTLNWKVPDEYMVSKTPTNTDTTRVGYAPLSQGVVKATGGSMASSYLGKAVGGSLTPESSDGVEVNGPAHANGGVDLPKQNAQVEGGETIKGDYVFSKMLGFADLHKPLMKAKGIIEKKPATPERVNAIKMLEQKENDLMMAQEYFKKQHGIK